MKKRIFSFFLALCMLCTLLPTTVFAATTSSGLEYEIVDNSYVKITRYSGSATTLTVPDTIGGKPVKVIGNAAFVNCTDLKNITLSKNLTEIGNGAFSNCMDLESITIPTGVTKIGSDAFSYCQSLTTITIPKNVTEIGLRAFFDCFSLTSIKVSSENKDFSSSNGVLFNKDKTKLICYPGGKSGNSYTIPDSVIYIGPCAFEGANIYDITIPDSVTSISNNAFTNSTLYDITIPDSVTSIAQDAFYHSEFLRSIEVSSGNKNYSSYDGVLFNKDKTELIRHPMNKYDGSGLYTIPNGVIEIGYYAFDGCDTLICITIPTSITSIGYSAFTNCVNLWHVLYQGNETQWNSLKISSYNTSLTNAIRHYNAKGDEVRKLNKTTCTERILHDCTLCDAVRSQPISGGKHTLPDTWTIVTEPTCSAPGLERKDCSKCDYSKTQAIPATGEHSYTIEVNGSRTPATCMTTGSVTFKCSGCDATDVKTLEKDPSNHTGNNHTINEKDPTCVTPGYSGDTVCECGVTIEEGETIPATGIHSYVDSVCRNCGAIGGKCGDDLYWLYDGEGTITITGTGDMYSYSNTDENNRCPWVEYEDDITTVVIEEGATSVGYCAFHACDRLQNVSLPETLTKIAAHGFSFCPALEEIQLPDGLQEIDSYAFSNSGLKSIHLGAAVEAIGDRNPFTKCGDMQQITVAANNPYYCAVDNVLFTKDMKTLLCYPGGLTQESYTIPDGVTIVGDYGFSENMNIKTVNMPDTVETLRYGAFMACRKLHQLELSSGLKEIESLALNHTDIRNLAFPASLKFIDYLACVVDTLETITFEGDVPQIDAGAFGNDNRRTVATAYYPAGNPTWTADKLQNYGGELTWLPSDHEHTDDWVKDHRCDLCGEVISLCADTDDHKCDICDEVISLCADDNNDHKCDICGESVSLCADADGDHACDICGKEIGLCEDTDDDHKCDTCGETISLCADGDNDHDCDICGKEIGLCTDADDDHKCDTCGETISLCEDTDDDHKCDTCGEIISLCEDTDDDHKCDTCGEIISLCTDADGDHACDICGKEIGLCADGNNDHKCDACGEVISLCTGGEATCAAAAICDICGQSYGELNGQYHTGSTEIRNKKEATESEPGYTGDIHCLDCGELLEAGTEIPVLPAPSVPSTPVQPSKPNWTNIFNKWFGNWWGNGDDEEEKCDHSYKAVVTDPTCTEKGYTTHTCEKCGDSYKDSYVDATGHNYVRNVCKHCGAKKSIGWFDWIFKWYR